MRIALFYHSLVSDWNHGNAHFLRGVAWELQARGHELRIFEPEDSWSRNNLLAEHGPPAINAFHRAFPNLQSTQYRLNDLRMDEWLDQTDIAIIHEWNDPRVIAAAGECRRQNSAFRLFFHDTHHRLFSAEHEMSCFDLRSYDAVLAYGASLKDNYERLGWGRQVHVWHEAADTRTFYPRPAEFKQGDVVWIGNWGDEERTEELRDYFISPVQRLGVHAQVYGVRYPEPALRELERASIYYGGWLPNFEVPNIFARFRATVHIPRRPYVERLPGIPTIRPFEALACGIPLVSSPWQDSEGLFRVGEDFLMAHDRFEMQKHLKDILNDQSLAEHLASHGLDTIRTRHTCAHRVVELVAIYGQLKSPAMKSDSAIPVEVS